MKIVEYTLKDKTSITWALQAAMKVSIKKNSPVLVKYDGIYMYITNDTDIRNAHLLYLRKIAMKQAVLKHGGRKYDI